MAYLRCGQRIIVAEPATKVRKRRPVKRWRFEWRRRAEAAEQELEAAIAACERELTRDGIFRSMIDRRSQQSGLTTSPSGRNSRVRIQPLQNWHVGDAANFQCLNDLLSAAENRRSSPIPDGPSPCARWPLYPIVELSPIFSLTYSPSPRLRSPPWRSLDAENFASRAGCNPLTSSLNECSFIRNMTRFTAPLPGRRPGHLHAEVP
jgi:hypothetical protein